MNYFIEGSAKGLSAAVLSETKVKRGRGNVSIPSGLCSGDLLNFLCVGMDRFRIC
jgi:hypothetical protein